MASYQPSKKQAMASNSTITAIGSYVPSTILSNADLETMVETSDEWIRQRTGILERRISGSDEGVTDLIFGAIDDMVERYGTTLEDVDYILVATSTPETIFPSMAARVQARYGIRACGSTDLQAACAGFAVALQMGNGLLLSGLYRKVLVVGADALSKITDYTDRTTCILFGDGAGAVMLETSADGIGQLLAAYSHTDGQSGHHLYLSNLSSTLNGQPLQTHGKIVQNGREVYRWAVSQVTQGIETLMSNSGLTPRDINWFVPHSANQRIIDAMCERTGFAPEQVLSSITYYGNTSAASIPLALSEAVRSGVVNKDDLLLLYGFGGGLTQAGIVLRWSI